MRIDTLTSTNDKSISIDSNNPCNVACNDTTFLCCPPQAQSSYKSFVSVCSFSGGSFHNCDCYITLTIHTLPYTFIAPKTHASTQIYPFLNVIYDGKIF